MFCSSCGEKHVNQGSAACPYCGAGANAQSSAGSVDGVLTLPWKAGIFLAGLVAGFKSMLVFVVLLMLSGFLYRTYHKSFPIRARDARKTFLAAALIVLVFYVVLFAGAIWFPQMVKYL